MQCTAPLLTSKRRSLTRRRPALGRRVSSSSTRRAALPASVLRSGSVSAKRARPTSTRTASTAPSNIQWIRAILGTGWFGSSLDKIVQLACIAPRQRGPLRSPIYRSSKFPGSTRNETDNMFHVIACPWRTICTYTGQEGGAGSQSPAAPRPAQTPSLQYRLRILRHCGKPISVCLFASCQLLATKAAPIAQATNEADTSPGQGDTSSAASVLGTEWAWHSAVFLVSSAWGAIAKYTGKPEYYCAVAAVAWTVAYGFIAFGEGSLGKATSVAIASTVFSGVLADGVAREKGTGLPRRQKGTDLLRIIPLVLGLTIVLDILVSKAINCDTLFEMGKCSAPFLYVTMLPPCWTLVAFCVWTLKETFDGVENRRDPTTTGTELGSTPSTVDGTTSEASARRE